MKKKFIAKINHFGVLFFGVDKFDASENLPFLTLQVRG